MQRSRYVTLLFVVSSLALPGDAGAQAKSDFASTEAAVPPAPNASENYPLSYTGGAPAPIAAALDPDDSTYNRVVSCGGLSGVGTAVFYDTVSITNNSLGTATIVAETSDVGTPGACAVDTFLTAYAPTFNAASPLTGCVAADDDSGPSFCSRVTFDVPKGGTAVLVATSFGNGSTFLY